MTLMTFYKIMNTDTGLFMTASGGFNSKGKIWESMANLKNALRGKGYYNRQRLSNGDTPYYLPLPDNNIKIIEVIVEHTDGNNWSLNETVARERRFIELAEQHGDSFSTLVRRIEDQKLTEQFQWAMIVNSGYDWKAGKAIGDITKILEAMKACKLKLNKDYKKVSHHHKSSIAFARKEDAMRVRLMVDCPVTSINITDYMEIDLDTESQ
jgi:uncharacterized protein YegJ (DUF2314 family)